MRERMRERENPNEIENEREGKEEDKGEKDSTKGKDEDGSSWGRRRRMGLVLLAWAGRACGDAGVCRWLGYNSGLEES